MKVLPVRRLPHGVRMKETSLQHLAAAATDVKYYDQTSTLSPVSAQSCAGKMGDADM